MTTSNHLFKTLEAGESKRSTNSLSKHVNTFLERKRLQFMIAKPVNHVMSLISRLVRCHCIKNHSRLTKRTLTPSLFAPVRWPVVSNEPKRLSFVFYSWIDDCKMSYLATIREGTNRKVDPRIGWIYRAGPQICEM